MQEGIKMNTLLELESKNKPYIVDILDSGVVLFKQLIPTEKIQTLQLEVNKTREIVMSKIITMERPLKTYSDIAERELGRLDYRCGFNAEIFNEVAHPIDKIINEISSTIEFRRYWGLITSLGGAGPTNMHRDVYPFLNTTTGVNLGSDEINFPPYYFTVLIPLVNVTKENGPTEYIKYSKSKKIVDADKAEIYAPLTSPGDVTIFDGRTLHRGSANNTQEERVIAYITYVANWYHDQTFEINDYLFPELAVKDI